MKILLAKHVDGRIQDDLIELEVTTSDWQAILLSEYVKYKDTVYKYAHDRVSDKVIFLSIHPYELRT